jgi:hypothetical protein
VVTIGRGLAAGVIFAGIALGSAGQASAEDPIAGIYTYTQAGLPPSTWSIYPTCVPAGCVLHIEDTTPHKGPLSDQPGYSGDARLVNDRWTLGINNTGGITCPDGSTADYSNVYTFDEKTLSGTVTTLHGSVCGLQPAQNKQPFTLVYQSPLPIPVELYPLQCPTWPNCNYDTVIPGQLSPPPPPPT